MNELSEREEERCALCVALAKKIIFLRGKGKTETEILDVILTLAEFEIELSCRKKIVHSGGCYDGEE